jgi:hypothetical protein
MGGRAGDAGGVLYAHDTLPVVFLNRITTTTFFFFFNVHTNTNTRRAWGMDCARYARGRGGHGGRRDAWGSGGGGRWDTGERGRGGRAARAARVVDDRHGAGAGAAAVAVGEDWTGGTVDNGGGAARGSSGYVPSLSGHCRCSCELGL